MLVGDHRITERVVLVVIFDDRARQLRAFLDPETLGQRTGSDIPDHDLDRNNLDLADQLLAHVQPPDEVRGHPDRPERSENMFGNAVVDDALAADRSALLRIERRGVVLEILDERSRLWTLVKDLCLALIDLAATSHGSRHSNGEN